MIYQGTFKDIEDREFTVNITTNGITSSTKKIVLGETPFTTEIETSDAHIYKPCKYSSATIKVISDDYMFDVYSSSAQQNLVELIDESGTIRWIGYTTPNLYSMGYEKPEEEIELEAIDGLSTLQYYKYTPLDVSKSIVKILDVLLNLIAKCGTYNQIYISTNTQYSTSSNDCLMSKCYISEQNFFDEDGEAMTCKEVLEEICKYFGLTCIADGTNVYFLDYDAIKNGINTYYKFNLNGNRTTVTISQSKDISGKDYLSNGGQISLDNVYNKVAVKDSLYSFDSVIPSIWDDLIPYVNPDNKQYAERFEGNTEVGGKHICYFKYYRNPNYKTYAYNSSWGLVSDDTERNYNFTKSYVGCTITKAYFKKVETFDTTLSNFDFTDYVLLHVHNKTNSISKPMLELVNNDDKPSFIGGRNSYLIIKGNFLMMDREGSMYIMQGYGNKDDNFNKDQLYINAKLEYGGKYWNGIGWVDNECKFQLPFDSNGQTDHCINKQFPVKNTVTWEMGLDASGYAVKMPENEILTGKPKFTLYSPQKFDGDYRCDAVWLSDFDIVAKVANFDDADNSSDTEYSNIINEDFVNELKTEEFKICTWDNKEANYSSVCYLYNNNYYFLDEVYNNSNKQFLRPEKQLIYKLVNQYSTPSVILNLPLKNEINIYATVTDKWLDDKIFIVDSMKIDWEQNLSEIRLIEKK